MQKGIRAGRQDTLPALRLQDNSQGACSVQKACGGTITMGELENLIGHLQMQNQQLQAVLMQKQALSMQSREIEKALEHLETASDDVYRTVGPILVKVPGSEVKKQLEDDKEEVDLKLKTIESQEKKLRDKLKESQEKIQGMMPQGQGG